MQLSNNASDFKEPNWSIVVHDDMTNLLYKGVIVAHQSDKYGAVIVTGCPKAREVVTKVIDRANANKRKRLRDAASIRVIAIQRDITAHARATNIVLAPLVARENA